MVSTQAHTGLTQQSYKHRVTSFSSHMHAPPVRHIKAKGDEREWRKRTELKQNNKNIPVHIVFLPASLFNCRQINSDFSLDGPMWKRKKA